MRYAAPRASAGATQDVQMHAQASKWGQRTARVLPFERTVIQVGLCPRALRATLHSPSQAHTLRQSSWPAKCNRARLGKTVVILTCSLPPSTNLHTSWTGQRRPYFSFATAPGYHTGAKHSLTTGSRVFCALPTAPSSEYGTQVSLSCLLCCISMASAPIVSFCALIDERSCQAFDLISLFTRRLHHGKHTVHRQGRWLQRLARSR